MANDFGPSPVAALTAATVDATTKLPLSKAGARNEIDASELFQGLATVSGSQTLTLPPGTFSFASSGVGDIVFLPTAGLGSLVVTGGPLIPKNGVSGWDGNQYGFAVPGDTVSTSGLKSVVAGQVKVTDGSTGLGSLVANGFTLQPTAADATHSLVASHVGSDWVLDTTPNANFTVKSTGQIQLISNGVNAFLCDTGINVYMQSTNLILGSGNAVGLRGGAGVLAITNGSTGGGGISSVANSPAQIAANTNNYSPGAGLFQRWNSDASRNVTGMVAGVDGEKREIWNVGAQNIVLKNADAASAAANRFTNSTGADITLAANKCAVATYDLISTTWRVVLLP